MNYAGGSKNRSGCTRAAETCDVAWPAVATTATCEVLPTFPGYECIRKIGEGGMGIVYEARDRKLGRVVAIKTIADGRYASREQLDRFLAEAEAVARLKHPNVIAIYSVGEHEGRPYLSLEHAEGGSLAERLAEGRMGTRLAVELVEATRRAPCMPRTRLGLSTAISASSNILLTADGTPKSQPIFGPCRPCALLGSDSCRAPFRGRCAGLAQLHVAPEQA